MPLPLSPAYPLDIEPPDRLTHGPEISLGMDDRNPNQLPSQICGHAAPRLSFPECFSRAYSRRINRAGGSDSAIAKALGIVVLRAFGQVPARRFDNQSSGLKINRGGDGPAALVISEQQRAQIAGLNAAIDNTSKAVAMVETKKTEPAATPVLARSGGWQPQFGLLAIGNALCGTTTSLAYCA